MTWLTQHASGTKKIVRTKWRQTLERKIESTMVHPETESSRLRSNASQQKNEQHTREIQNQIFPLRTHKNLTSTEVTALPPSFD
jgi:hypothetical protein